MAEHILASLEEHTASYGDKHIFYHAVGPANGPLLIFVHGWPASPKTWYHQLALFSQLGFRCVAPDMPGYGRSTVTRDAADYSQERIVEALLALLAHTGRDRAVWIGHDWGAGCVWSLAAHHPEVCVAVANLVVPYRTVEAGLEQAARGVNRAVYPLEKYPDGQWNYIRYYIESLEQAVRFQDDNVAGFTKLVFGREEILQRGQDASCPPDGRSRPAPTATCVADGGFLGGAATVPDASAIPDEAVLLPVAILSELTAALRRNGYFAPAAYYVNDDANKRYAAAAAVPTHDLRMPVLFVEARRDSVCETVTSRLAEAQRRHCANLTEASVDAGHWVHLERPEVVNAAIARWLATEAWEEWPGAWRTVTRRR